MLLLIEALRLLTGKVRPGRCRGRASGDGPPVGGGDAMLVVGKRMVGVEREAWEDDVRKKRAVKVA